MSMRLRVCGLNALEEDRRYDALVATVGFESRATHVARQLSGRVREVWGFDYQQNHVHAYHRNRAFFSEHRILEEPDSAYRKRVALLVEEVRSMLPADEKTGERVTPRVAVDISCMDRDRLARTVSALTVDQSEPIEIDFFYSLAQFEEGLVGSEGTVLVNRPVDGLEGWPSDPDAGLVCLLGMGFESRLALAAIETLEPHRTIALIPRGEDPRYDDVVLERNQDLLAGDMTLARHEYRVPDLLQTVLDLDATVTALRRRARVVIVPLGPKSLALAAVLVGIAHSENVTVWRLSADDGRHPEDRVASERVVGIAVTVEKTSDLL